MRITLLLAIGVFCAAGVLASDPPGRYGVDAPELAHLGSDAIGVKTLHLVQHGQIDYTTGARAIFVASGAHRYLLTFKEGGHAIGLNPAPDSMRERLWDQDWFEHPVWRKDRINAINTHFITAFLDRYVKGLELLQAQARSAQ